MDSTMTGMLEDFLVKRAWWDQEDRERFSAAFGVFAKSKAVTSDTASGTLAELGKIYDELEREFGVVFLSNLNLVGSPNGRAADC